MARDAQDARGALVHEECNTVIGRSCRCRCNAISPFASPATSPVEMDRAKPKKEPIVEKYFSAMTISVDNVNIERENGGRVTRGVHPWFQIGRLQRMGGGGADSSHLTKPRRDSIESESTCRGKARLDSTLSLSLPP